MARVTMKNFEDKPALPPPPSNIVIDYEDPTLYFVSRNI